MSFISRLRRSRQHRVSILSAYLVHPLPLRGTSPQGETRALRDWLSMSYGMINILLIGSLRSPSPIRLRRTAPCSGGRIKHLEPSLRKRLCSKHGLLCPRLRGKGGGASHQRGIAFPRPSGRLYGFSCCRKAAFILAPIRALTTTLAPKARQT